MGVTGFNDFCNAGVAGEGILSDNLLAKAVLPVPLMVMVGTMGILSVGDPEQGTDLSLRLLGIGFFASGGDV